MVVFFGGEVDARIRSGPCRLYVDRLLGEKRRVPTSKTQHSASGGGAASRYTIGAMPEGTSRDRPVVWGVLGARHFALMAAIPAMQHRLTGEQQCGDVLRAVDALLASISSLPCGVISNHTAENRVQRARSPRNEPRSSIPIVHSAGLKVCSG